MILSPLRLEDCAQAARLHQASFFKGWSQDSLQSTFQTHDTFGLQVREKDVFLGFILWREMGDEAEILTLVVTSTRQHKGYGSALLHALYARLRNKKISTLFIEVAEDNNSALCFYHKHMFLSLGKRQNYYARENNTHICALTFYKKIV